MSNIKELDSWCQEARELLGVSLRRLSMKLTTDDLSEGLKALSRLASQGAVRDRFMTEYEALARESKTLADRAKNKGSKDGETDREQAFESMAKRLAELKARIEVELPLAQARDDYLRRLKDCENTLDIFKTLPGAQADKPTQAIREARKLAAAMDSKAALTSAVDALGEPFAAAMESARKAQRDAAARIQEQHAAMPDCEQKILEVSDLLAFVNTEGVGLSAEAQQLTQGLAKARNLQAANDWIGARQALAGLPTRTSCEALRDKALKQIDAGHPAAAQGRAAIGQLKTLVEPLAWQPLEARLWRAIADLAGPTADEAAGQAVKDVVNAITARVQSAEQDNAQLVKQIDAIDRGLSDLRALARTSDLLGLTDRLQALRNLHAQKRQAQGAAQADGLATDLERMRQNTEDLHRQWQAVAPSMVDLLAELDAQAADPTAPQDLRDAAARQSARLASTAALVEAREWAGLLDLHASARQTLDGFQSAKEAFLSFSEAREAGDMKARSEFKRLRTRFDTLGQTLTAGQVEPARMLAPLERQLVAIESAWSGKWVSASNNAALDLGTTLLALAQLEKQAVAAGSPEGVRQARDAQRQDEERGRFDAVRRSLENAMALLESLDPVQARRLRDEADRIGDDAGTPWSERVRALERTSAAIDAAVTTAQALCSARKEAMALKCQAMEVQLDAQWNELVKSGGEGKKFEGMFQAMRDELADLAVMARSPNLEAAKRNEAAINALDVRMGELRNQSLDGKDPFQSVTDALEDLKKRLKDQDARLQANVPSTLVSLKKRLADVQGALYTTDVADSLKELAALQSALEQAVAEATLHEAKRQGIHASIPILQRRIEVMRSDGRAPDYCRDLQRRLEDVKQQAEMPDRLHTASSALDRLRADVETAIQRPEEALAKQKALLLEVQNQQLLQTQWTAALKVFRSTKRPRAAAAVEAPGGDPSQLEEVDRLLALAQTSAQVGDHAEALRRLKLCEQRAAEVVADPSGPGIGARRALPQNARQYGDAARQMIDALQAFPGQVSAKVPGLPPAVLDRITQATDSFAARFDATLFDSHAALLSDGKAAIRTRRADREQALEKVRGLQSLLIDHPVLTGLRVNPISVQLHQAARRLSQRLTSLEANIRRSVH
ncbi:hypothetical protein [Roseateles amylovorans]|uniref:DUF349 domain-containing protein n=1 Tax=Roseateles amylovorans TaxID=2978473 RepID=A0ABY6AWQ2_9BURK|nr:hypothetical protein [Roseateles amylovorans]UXH76189.1 hypothetical protein N4261_14025 [Roseateles amylovorans]